MRKEAVAAARSFLGVRFRHQGRSPSQGFDCLGLLLAVADAIGLQFAPELAAMQRRTDYTHLPDAEELRAGLQATLAEIPAQEMQAGDIVLLRVQGRAQHLALLGDYGADGALSLIHAYAPLRKVVEHRFDASWQQALEAAYRLPED